MGSGGFLRKQRKASMTLNKGALWQKAFMWVGPNGKLVDMSNYVIQAAFKDSGDAAPDNLFAEYNGFIKNNLTKGYFVWTIPADVSNGYTFTSREFDIVLIPVTLTDTSSTDTTLDVAGGTHITANAGTPFAGIAVNDFIRLSGGTNTAAYGSGANESNNWSLYQVSATNSSTTIDVSLATMLGSDEANDTNLTIEEVTLINEERMRLISGSVRLKDQVASTNLTTATLAEPLPVDEPVYFQTQLNMLLTMVHFGDRFVQAYDLGPMGTLYCLNFDEFVAFEAAPTHP